MDGKRRLARIAPSCIASGLAIWCSSRLTIIMYTGGWRYKQLFFRSHESLAEGPAVRRPRYAWSAFISGVSFCGLHRSTVCQLRLFSTAVCLTAISSVCPLITKKGPTAWSTCYSVSAMAIGVRCYRVWVGAALLTTGNVTITTFSGSNERNV